LITSNRTSHHQGFLRIQYRTGGDRHLPAFITAVPNYR
jgi:hypothetical protein